MTDVRQQQREGAADAPDPHRWKTPAVCLAGGFMVLLDVSIVHVALPSIRTGLEATQSASCRGWSRVTR